MHGHNDVHVRKIGAILLEGFFQRNFEDCSQNEKCQRLTLIHIAKGFDMLNFCEIWSYSILESLYT